MRPVAEIQRSQVQHPTPDQAGNQSRGTSKILPKARSHDSLPQAYSQPSNRTLQRPRLCSEPIQALERQGIIQCDSMSIEEAWSRFGIRVPKSDDHTQSRAPPETYINPRTRPSTLTGQCMGTSSLSKEVGMIKAGSKSCCVSQPIGSAPIVSGQPVPRKKSIAQSIKSVLRPNRLPSGQHLSSLPISQSRERTTFIPILTRQSVATIDDNRNIPSRRRLGVQQIPCVSVSLTGTQAKGFIKRLEVARNKEEMVDQLGRPTSCNDSPYSIAKPTINRTSGLTKVASSLPVRRDAVEQAHCLQTVQREDLRARSSYKSEGEVHQLEQCHGNDSQANTCDSDSESEYSCGTFSECSFASSSVQSQSDKAKKLWRCLESMLKGHVQSSIATVGPSSIKKARLHVSRIPRLQRGKIFETKRPAPKERTMERPSRIPVATSRLAKKQNICEIRRKCSILTQTITLLRSMSNSTPFRSDSIGTAASTSYARFLPPRERRRREEALKQRIWGEQSLRMY